MLCSSYMSIASGNMHQVLTVPDLIKHSQVSIASDLFHQSI